MLFQWLELKQSKLGIVCWCSACGWRVGAVSVPVPTGPHVAISGRLWGKRVEPESLLRSGLGTAWREES